LELKCFVFPGWQPRIRSASSKRVWMDEAPEAFAYRCLPLTIANSHGWEILSACGFEVEWNGGMAVEDVCVRPDAGAREPDVPVTLFGEGIFTIHVQGLFRTPPGWNIHVGGPPNSFKDGVAPLAGVIETDWTPYTFTMNWRLTRPGHVVRFEEDEPIAHFFPVERSMIENIEPRFVPIAEDPDLQASFETWSRSRDAFQARMREHPPRKPSEKWQKLYHRGLAPDGQRAVADHQAKLRVREFADGGLVQPAPRAAPAGVEPAPLDAPPVGDAAWKIAKYEWLLETMERQRALSNAASGIFRCAKLTTEEFLDNFYAPGRPTILCGDMENWPALRKWTPEYLRSTIGDAVVECQGGRTSNDRFELAKDAHRRRMPFDRFIDLVVNSPGNDLYITAYNSLANAAALAPLQADLGRLDRVLDYARGELGGMAWVGPAGTFTPLHHDLTNNLLVQLTGRKRVVLASPGETPKLHNTTHVFSEVSDLTASDIDREAYPRIAQVRRLDFILGPGEALFIPVGWWHQVTALDFSVSMTYTNFLWPNEGHADHPASG